MLVCLFIIAISVYPTILPYSSLCLCIPYSIGVLFATLMYFQLCWCTSHYFPLKINKILLISKKKQYLCTLKQIFNAHTYAYANLTYYHSSPNKSPRARHNYIKINPNCRHNCIITNQMRGLLCAFFFNITFTHQHEVADTK